MVSGGSARLSELSPSHAGCLPRKELYETWEMARRVRRRFRGGRVIDLGGGHGLLAQVMLLLDDSSPNALVVDTALPASSGRVHQVLTQAWPRLTGRITLSPARWRTPRFSPPTSSSRAMRAGASLIGCSSGPSPRGHGWPCCHVLTAGDAGQLAGWVDGPLAIDIAQAMRLQQQGCRIWTQVIPADITAKHRLLPGAPALFLSTSG